MRPHQLAALTLCLAVVFGASPPAFSQSSPTPEETEAFTAETLRDACENLAFAVRGLSPISQEDPGAMLCLGFLAGWSQAMEGVRDKPYCLPAVARERPGDLADLIVSYVDSHPELRSASAHQALLATLVDAFPCESEGAAVPEANDGASSNR